MSTRITRIDSDGWAYGENGVFLQPSACKRHGITPETVPGTLRYIPDSQADESPAEAERVGYHPKMTLLSPRESHRQRLVEVALGEYIRATTRLWLGAKDVGTNKESGEALTLTAGAAARLAVAAADAAIKAEEEGR